MQKEQQLASTAATWVGSTAAAAVSVHIAKNKVNWTWLSSKKTVAQLRRSLAARSPDKLLKPRSSSSLRAAAWVRHGARPALFIWARSHRLEKRVLETYVNRDKVRRLGVPKCLDYLRKMCTKTCSISVKASAYSRYWVLLLCTQSMWANTDFREEILQILTRGITVPHKIVWKFENPHSQFDRPLKLRFCVFIFEWLPEREGQKMWKKVA